MPEILPPSPDDPSLDTPHEAQQEPTLAEEYADHVRHEIERTNGTLTQVQEEILRTFPSVASVVLPPRGYETFTDISAAFPPTTYAEIVDDEIVDAEVHDSAAPALPQVFVCEHCGSRHTVEENLIPAVPDESLPACCISCRPDVYLYCDHCDSYIVPSEGVDVNVYDRSQEAGTLLFHHTICQSCLDGGPDGVFTCENCGYVFSDRQVVQCEVEVEDEIEETEYHIECDVCAGVQVEYCDPCGRAYRHDEDGCSHIMRERREREAQLAAEANAVTIGTLLKRRSAITAGRERWTQSSSFIVGDATDRFLQRPVGIEFETTAPGREPEFKAWVKGSLPGWGIHSDGSIDGDEFVTPPIGGGLIDDHVRMFYALCDDHKVIMARPAIGMHVHVHAKDIWALIQVDEGRWEKRPFDMGTFRHTYETGETHSFSVRDAQDAIIVFGAAASSVCRQLVGGARRNSRFCNSGFNIRAKNSSMVVGVNKLGTHDYPTLAVRSHTIEFRVWPGTDVVEKALARIETSQKIVERMHEMLIREDTEFAKDRLIQMQGLFYDGERINGHGKYEDRMAAGHAFVDKLSSFLGLSEETRDRHHKTITTIIDNIAVRNGVFPESI